MANVAHEPVKRAMNRIRELSADEETRRLESVPQEVMEDVLAKLATLVS